jgi:hypothetical protein
MNTPMILHGGDGELTPGSFAVPPGGAGMQVNVQLKQYAAESLRNGVLDSPAVDDVLRATVELGVKLMPVYPESRNRRRKTEFVVDVPDVETAERVVDRLNGLEATEAVYFKPADQLP